MDWLRSVLALSLLTAAAFAQSSPAPPDPGPGQNELPPRSQASQDRDREAGESSSRDTRIDITPPKNDGKDHPASGAAVSEAEAGDRDHAGDVQEVHPWNPYRAIRDENVAEYYFKRGNYRAALARFEDSLIWKEGDAAANFGMAQCYEKLDDPVHAAEHYREYLKILPNGPLSKDARKALKKLHDPGTKNEAQARSAPTP